MTKIKITNPINIIKSLLLKKRIKKIRLAHEASYQTILFINAEMKKAHPDSFSHY